MTMEEISMRDGWLGRSTNSVRRGGGVWLGVVIFCILPFGLDSFFLFVASLTLAYAIASLGFGLLVGSSGQVSLAHSVPFAVGAYAVALGAEHGLNVWLALLAGIVLSILISVVAGLVTLRLSEFYFALATIGLVVVLQNYLAGASFSGGSDGLPAPVITFFSTGRGTTFDQYVAVALIAIVAIIFTRNINASFVGRAFNGIRDVPQAAASCGVFVFRTKLLAFAVSSVYATVAGAVYAGLVTLVSPDQFGFNLVLLFLAILIVGGRTSIAGAFVGAAAFTYVPQALQPAQGAQDLIFGLAIMLTMLVAPDGLWPTAVRLVRQAGRRLLAGRRPSGNRQDSLRSVPPEHAAAAVTTEAVAAAPVNAEQASLHLDQTGPRGADGPTVVLASGAGAGARAGPPRLVVTGISKSFGGVPALSDVSLELHAGEILALIGPNGSGKTTLLNCITRILPPDAGTVLLDGADITGMRADQVADRGIRRTFQSPQLISSRTVLENVMLGAHCDARTWLGAVLAGRVLTGKREARAEAAARQALAALGLARYAAMPMSAVEGPTQKLIEVARCLAGNPRVMFFDEIASGINSFEKDDLAERIHELRAEHDVSLILVEHDLDFVTKVADSMVVLQSGSVIAKGRPGPVLSAQPVREAYFGV
jgi:branched-chain amino acid transport system permease protein